MVWCHLQFVYCLCLFCGCLQARTGQYWQLPPLSLCPSLATEMACTWPWARPTVVSICQPIMGVLGKRSAMCCDLYYECIGTDLGFLYVHMYCTSVYYICTYGLCRTLSSVPTTGNWYSIASNAYGGDNW